MITDETAARIDAESRALDWQERAQAAELRSLRLEEELTDLRRVVAELAPVGAAARREVAELRAMRDLARECLEELWRAACGGADAPLPAVRLQAEDLRAVVIRRALAPDSAARIMTLEHSLTEARAGEEAWHCYARALRRQIGEAVAELSEGRADGALRALVAPVAGRS